MTLAEDRVSERQDFFRVLCWHVSGAYIGYCLVECDAVWFGRQRHTDIMKAVGVWGYKAQHLTKHYFEEKKQRSRTELPYFL